jgi:hypothetical protein
MGGLGGCFSISTCPGLSCMLPAPARPRSSEKRAPIGQLPCPVHDKIYYAAWPSREWELHTLPDVPCTVGSRARIPVVPIIMVLH